MYLTALLTLLAVTPHAEVTAALEHSLQTQEPTNYRYVILDSDKPDEDYRGLQELLNSTFSHDPDIIQPIRLGPTLAAVDLQILDCYPTYEKLAKTEYFYHAHVETLIDVEPYTQNGQKFTKKWITTQVIPKTLEPVLLPLHTRTNSNVPIVRFSHLNSVSRSTINGGLYYEFRQIAIGMDLNTYLRSRGYDYEEAKKRGNIESTITLISEITGKPRVTDAFLGRFTRPSVGPSVASITRDPRNGQTKAINDPFRNPFGYCDSARELVLTTPNGHFEYTIWDVDNLGNATLTAAVPDDIASDHLIPTPFTKQLVPSISCIRCHQQDSGHRRMIEVDNEKIVDKNDYKILIPYHTDPRDYAHIQPGIESILQMSRDSHDIAMTRTNSRTVQQTYSHIVLRYNDYNFGYIDEAKALKELGFEQFPPDSLHPLVILLKAGKQISRTQWLGAYQDVLEECYLYHNVVVSDQPSSGS